MSQNPAVHVLKEELHKFDTYFEDAPTVDEQKDRVANKRILLHLTNAFVDKNWKRGGHLKGDNVHWVFDKLGGHFLSFLGSEDALWVLLLFYYMP